MNKNTSVETQKGCIRTKIKFAKSQSDGRTIGFVSFNPVTGRMYGVRQDYPYPKKIVLVDKRISSDIIYNVLYDCKLVKMATGDGYIAIKADPVQFKATVETIYIKNNTYLVEVKFGNVLIRFNPYSGNKDTVKDLSKCKELLSRRTDIKDISQVISDFEKAANRLIMMMNNDRFTKFR